METKPTNPKDSIGSTKTPVSVLPWPVVFEAGLGMLEGSCKYGRHNYREKGVRYSIYFDATMRHLTSWWEGEDDDPDSGLSHVTKAISSLMVLRDAMMSGKFTDDRPPSTFPDFVTQFNPVSKSIIDKYPNPEPPYINDHGK